MSFKEIYDKWSSISIIWRILGGLLIGLALALLYRENIIHDETYIALLGTLFTGALKAVAPILVFFLVISALCNSKKGHGKQFRLIIGLYLASTVIAAILAVAGSFIFPITVTLENAASGSTVSTIDELITSLAVKVVQNPISALVDGNYLGILFWAVIGGLLFRSIGTDNSKKVVGEIAGVVTGIVKVIINFAPFGILGIIYKTVSENGLEIFTEYGQLLLLLVGCMLIVAFITNPAIVAFLIKGNPYPLSFKCLKNSAITAFFTRSSAANIPMNIKLCEDEGVDKEFYSVSIPLGATINMDGAAITITVMTLAAAHSVQPPVEVSFALACILAIVATIAACGASGVAGGSLLLIPLACSMFNISDDIAMQMVAIGFIIGVIQDSFETALNSSSDALFTIATDRHMKAKLAKEKADSAAE